MSDTKRVDETIRWIYDSCGLPFDQLTDTALRAALSSLVKHAARDAAAELHAWRMAWYGGTEYLKMFQQPNLDPATAKLATTAIEGYRDVTRKVFTEFGLDAP